MTGLGLECGPGINGDFFQLQASQSSKYSSDGFLLTGVQVYLKSFVKSRFVTFRKK